MDLSKVEVKKEGNSQVEISGEIPAEDFEKAYRMALDEYQKNADIPGFRQGNIPEKVLVEKVGENVILEKAAEYAIQAFYGQFIQEKQIEAIGRPEVSITKIARNNPLGFTIKTAVMPDMELPDYKAIAKQVAEKGSEAITVEDKEVTDTLEHLQKSQARQKQAQNQQDSGSGIITSPDGSTDGDTQNAEPELPPLDDEFAKSLGKFESLDQLKDTIRTNIKMEKEAKQKEQKRMEILDEIAKKIDITLPDVMISAEKEKMMGELKSSVENMGMKWQDYLNHVKKSQEDIMQGWDDQARKRILYGLILQKIAEKEEVNVGEEEVNEYVKTLQEQYGGQQGAGTPSEDQLRQYAYGMIKHEKVLRTLENATSANDSSEGEASANDAS